MKIVLIGNVIDFEFVWFVLNFLKKCWFISWGIFGNFF